MAFSNILIIAIIFERSAYKMFWWTFCDRLSKLNKTQVKIRHLLVPHSSFSAVTFQILRCLIKYFNLFDAPILIFIENKCIEVALFGNWRFDLSIVVTKSNQFSCQVRSTQLGSHFQKNSQNFPQSVTSCEFEIFSDSITFMNENR